MEHGNHNCDLALEQNGSRIEDLELGNHIAGLELDNRSVSLVLRTDNHSEEMEPYSDHSHGRQRTSIQQYSSKEAS